MNWVKVATTLRLCFCVAVGLSVAAVGQQQKPTFRTGVEAVTLDVSVLDKDRHPVRGLTAADFTVLEDGQPQKIQTFSAIDFPDVVETTTATWTRTVGPDVRRNDDFADRRLVTIVLDDAVSMFGDDVLWTKRMAKDVINQMGPRDLVSVVYPLDKSSGQDFTTDHALLNAAVDRFNNAGSRNVMVMWPALLSTLQGVIENLTALPQHRKILFLVSAGIPLVPPPPISGERNPLQSPDHIAPSEVLRDAIKTLEDTLRAARRANVTVYTIDPAGLAPPGPKTSKLAVAGRDFLISVANGTGGFAVVDTNDTPGEVTRIYHENSSYYVLGYTSPNRRTEGKERKVEVRVNRPGVTVRTRSGYIEPPSPRAAAKSKTLPAAPVWTALAAPTPQGDLPLQVVAMPFPALPDRQAAIAIVAGVREPEEVGAEVRSEDKLDVLVNAYDMRGRRQAGTRLTASARWQPDVRREAGYEIFARLKLSPGRYQIRLAASAAGSAKSGSVFYDLEVPDFAKARLALSGLVFNLMPAVPAAPQDAFAGLLPVAPTSVRDFVPTDRVTVFARVSQGGKGTLAPASVRAWIVDAQGATAFDHTDTASVGRFASGRMADVMLTLPLAQLRPGQFLLTVETSTGKDTARREARFAISAGAAPAR